MKVSFRYSAAFLALLSLSPLSSAALSSAAPRVGTHQGFTRVVFDLPAATKRLSSQQTGQTLSIRLSKPLAAQHGKLNAPGVSSYSVSGQTIKLTLGTAKTGTTAHILPAPSTAAAGTQKARLVVDIPTPTPQTARTTTPKTSAFIRTASTTANRTPTVVIDPGHGGVDPGMTSQWLREEDVTLDVGLKVRDILRSHGVRVVMTRSRDTQLSTDKGRDLDMRSNMAKTGEVAAYVSIHVNAGNASAQGIETYYFGQPIGGANRSLAVAENGGGSVGRTLTKRAASTAQNMLGDILAQAKISFSRDLAQRVQGSLVRSTGAANRGVHTDAFYVIRDPKTAAILTEIGFGSSPTEGPKLASSRYRSQVAQGIANAILGFLHVN